MRPARIMPLCRRALHRSRLLQIALLSAFWLFGEVLARELRLPVPGAILGLAMMPALLASGRLNPASLARGASWLLAEMLLFFVPAVMVLLDHRELLGALGLKLMVVILLGCLLVMAGTALTVDLCHRWRNRRADA